MKNKILNLFLKTEKIPKRHVLKQVTFGYNVTAWTFVKSTQNTKQNSRSHITIRLGE